MDNERVDARLSSIWQNPQALVMGEEEDRWSQPKCPNCPEENYGYLHVNLGQMIVWPDLDGYDSPTGSRGEFILLPLYCEICGGTSALVVENHKGTFRLTMLTKNPALDRRVQED